MPPQETLLGQSARGPGRALNDIIDYDITGNLRLTNRRVLDELVQVADGLYLSKAHMKWWWGRDAWQVVAYFSSRTKVRVVGTK